MLAGCFYFAHHKQRNQIFYQPTDDDSKSFCATEVNTALRDVGCMIDIFPQLGMKSTKNTLLLKQFIGSTLHLKGGNKGGSYRRISADVVWLDELESFTRDVNGEGSPVFLSNKRLEGSLYPKSVRMTTPRLRLGSLIEAEVNNAKYLMKFNVRCPHCNALQVLEWGGNDCVFGMKWSKENPSVVWYECASNQCRIENNSLTEMNESGLWIDSKGSGVWIDEDGYFRANDETFSYVDTPRHLAFHIWTAYSPFVQWRQIVSEYLEAFSAYRKNGDITKLKAFKNTTLGETWEDVEEKVVLEPEVLHNRREHYPEKGFPKRGLALFGGYDTQDDRIEGSVYAYGLNNESFLVEHFILYGDLTGDEIWDRLADKWTQTYQREDGALLSCTRCFMDSGGHYSMQVYKFSKRIGLHNVIPIKGSSTYGAPFFKIRRGIHKDSGTYLTIIGTDAGKDKVYDRLRLTTDDLSAPTAGFYHFPIAPFTPLEWFKQLCAEYKIPTKSRGRVVMAYKQRTKRNEAVDCAVYSLACFEYSIEHYGLDLNSLAERVAHPERITTSEAAFITAAKKLGG